MQLANEILSDEAVHEAARRLRESFRASFGSASPQQVADMDTVLAWIMRQTELPESYKRHTSTPALHPG